MQLKTKVSKIKCTEIWLDSEGVLWLQPDPDIELSLEEVKACFARYEEMGINKNNKALQIIDARANVLMHKEARDYAAKHGKDFFIASAVISNSLSIRMLVNFFNMFYKAALPFKIFYKE